MLAQVEGVPGDGAGAAPAVVAEFVVRRNCSLSPAAMMLVFGSVAALSFAFGIAFAALGAWMILPFAGVELLALGAALVVHGLHATDCERVRVAGDVVTVEVVEGRGRRLHEFGISWVRLVKDESRLGGRLLLVARSAEVEVGRHLDQRRRAGLEKNLREALEAAWRAA